MKILPCDPDALPFRALNHLSAAIKKTPGKNFILWEIIESARKNDGHIYLIYEDAHLGTVYIEQHPDFMGVILFSGEQTEKWKDELQAFFLQKMKENNTESICFIGRPGLGKIFPKLTPIGTLYGITGGVVTKP